VAAFPVSDLVILAFFERAIFHILLSMLLVFYRIIHSSSQLKHVFSINPDASRATKNVNGWETRKIDQYHPEPPQFNGKC
jgi:hypothetical protein